MYHSFSIWIGPLSLYLSSVLTDSNVGLGWYKEDGCVPEIFRLPYSITIRSRLWLRPIENQVRNQFPMLASILWCFLQYSPLYFRVPELMTFWFVLASYSKELIFFLARETSLIVHAHMTRIRWLIKYFSLYVARSELPCLSGAPGYLPIRFPIRFHLNATSPDAVHTGEHPRAEFIFPQRMGSSYHWPDASLPGTV